SISRNKVASRRKVAAGLTRARPGLAVGIEKSDSGIPAALNRSGPKGASFDSPGRSAAEPWVMSPVSYDSPNGAEILSVPSALLESRPVGAYGRLCFIPRAGALGCRISPLQGSPGDFVAFVLPPVPVDFFWQEITVQEPREERRRHCFYLSAT